MRSRKGVKRGEKRGKKRVKCRKNAVGCNFFSLIMSGKKKKVKKR
jgi:hypothetical protein